MATQLQSRPIVTGLPRTKLETYKAWVRTLPCPCCGKKPSEFQHLKHTLHMSGSSLKAPDILGHPACADLHRKIHAEPINHAYLQIKWIFETLARAIAIGVLQVHKLEEEGPF